jgi:hypothetical protein
MLPSASPARLGQHARPQHKDARSPLLQISTGIKNSGSVGATAPDKQPGALHVRPRYSRRAARTK